MFINDISSFEVWNLVTLYLSLNIFLKYGPEIGPFSFYTGSAFFPSLFP